MRDWQLYVHSVQKRNKTTNPKSLRIQKAIDLIKFAMKEDEADGLPVPHEYLKQVLDSLEMEKSRG